MVVSIFHFVHFQFEHHDLPLHISLNIGRVRKIHGYSGDLHHTSFISMALFLIFIKFHFPATGGRRLLFHRRRWWFPPPSPCVHIPSLWIWFSRFNRVHPLCVLHLIYYATRLTWLHVAPSYLSHLSMPRQLMNLIQWLRIFSFISIFFYFQLIPFIFKNS